MKPGIQFWIIAALTIVIVYLILSRPAPYDSNKQAFQDTVSFLRAKEASIVAQGKRIIEAHRSKTRQDSLAIKRYNVEINILKKKVAISRARVDTIIRDNPELAVFVSQQDSIIVIQGQQIDTLKQAYASQIQTTEDLIANHDAQESIEARIDLEQTERIAYLEKQVRKQRRGNKLLKVGVIVLPVAALIFGSQL